MKLNTAYYKEMLACVFGYAIALGTVALLAQLIWGDKITERTAIWLAIFCLLSNHCFEKSEKESK